MEVRLFLRAVLDSGVLRAWTGAEEWEIDEPFAPDGSTPGATGALYTPDAGLLQAADATLRFGLRGRALVGKPVVGRVADVFTAGFRDDGSWKLLPFVRRGLLDRPMLEGGQYSVEIAPRVYRAPGVQWSNEEHQRSHPGDPAATPPVPPDTFFSQARALAQGIQGIHFPEVPNYDPDANYPHAVQQPAERPGGVGSPDAGLASGKTTAPGVRGGGGLAEVRLVAAPGRLPGGF